MFAWKAYLNTVIMCIQYVYIYRDRVLAEAPLCVRFIYQLTAAQEASGEKGTNKHTNKDHFWCLVTIWSIGIARRGLKELIFVKTWNSTKIDICHFFLPVAQN